MKILLRSFLGFFICVPLIFFLYLAGIIWMEKHKEKQMTKLVESSDFRLIDGYYCLEAKCFGTFDLGNNQFIEFFLLSDIAEDVIHQSKMLSKNWSLAVDICNILESSNSSQVCHLGAVNSSGTGTIKN